MNASNFSCSMLEIANIITKNAMSSVTMSP